MRNKTSSYDKHYLVHTDITGSGRGNSYPHRKDFAWNLLYLKQSWGANLNPPKKATSSSSSPSRSKTGLPHKDSSTSSPRGRRDVITSSRSYEMVNKKPRSAPEHSLPPLRNNSRTDSFRSPASDTVGFSADQKKGRSTGYDRLRHTGSERSRAALDSIPEHEPLKSSPNRAAPSGASHNSRRVTASSKREDSRAHRKRSDSKVSRFTATTYSSSLSSSQFPRLESKADGSVASSSGSISRSYGRDSRASSMSSRTTQWDEHEGRPFAEKMFIKSKPERQGKVTNTIRPEVLKTLVSAVTDELNSRGHASMHLDSKEVGSALNSAYSVKKHQPFTNLKFNVENSASTTRLRSSLYKTEEALRKPTIFRSNLTENRKQKKFNPLYHGEVTRSLVVDKQSHKHPLEGFSPAKWVPKLNNLNQSSGPWTTYETTR